MIIGNVFEIGWEQQPGIDSCAHEWETVQYRTRPDAPTGTVQRCARCGVPRCSSWNDSGNCVDRRHHDSVHIYPDGEFEPLGGVLPAGEGE